MPKMENWFLRPCDRDCCAYTPPERKAVLLCGLVYDHERKSDGDKVKTSHLKDVCGREVTTENSTYTLGEPEAEYVVWCRENGHHAPDDYEQPIILKKRSVS